MQLKAIDPAERADDVRGVPVQDLALAASRLGEAGKVSLRNGNDYLGEISAAELLRRIGPMPADSEVVVMGGPNHARRRSAMTTSMVELEDALVLHTHYSY